MLTHATPERIDTSCRAPLPRRLCTIVRSYGISACAFSWSRTPPWLTNTLVVGCVRVVQLVVRGMADAAAAGGDDPYKVLQVTPETESDRVMFAYNKLVRPTPFTSVQTTRPAPDTSRRIPPASHRTPHVMTLAAW
jgi:hypothetical protein